jgi:hypothetical protein
MRTLRSHTSASYRIRLIKVLPIDQAAFAPVDEAVPVIDRVLVLGEPHAADLRVALREVDEPWLDTEQDPAMETWHIRRRSSVGDELVSPWVQGPGHQERSVERVDGASIRHVAAEALAQPVPIDRLATLGMIEIHHMRLRVPSIERPEVLRGDYAFPVEVSHDGDGIPWLDHAPEEVEEPFELTIYNNNGALYVTLVLRWEPWTERGYAEHAAVMRFIEAMTAGGFELEDVDPAFR